MPIKIYPRIGGQDTIITVWNDSPSDDWRFVVNGDPSTLRIDKYDWILKSVRNEDYEANIVTTELPDGSIYMNYNEVIEARGGTEPYIFEVSDGILPTGLELNGSTGVISGHPTEMGDYTFTILMTDSSNPQLEDDQEYLVTIDDQTGIDDDDTRIPEKFALIGNYPNPFNSSTTINIRTSGEGNVHLDIFNLLGQRVVNLHDGYLDAGEHKFNWNAENSPSGIYFYKLTAGERSATKKMSLLK
ncbi:MAG: T9SS type A sorting domain-containing protein [candidate division Zixibacteria bacterium]|nr:T9SS type A sorting domain-containing protein [candidate division Zixibacteria bacterium]